MPRPLSITILVAAVAVSGGLLLASQAGAGPAGDVINATCPVSGEPVSAGATLDYEGHTIGFCCPACKRPFDGWSSERKDKFVAMASGEPAGKKKATAASQPDGKRKGDPYTLGTCIVSGEKLGSMGDPIVKTYDGREVRFCCNGCVKPFEKDQKGYLEKIDKEMIKQQMAYYPLDVCPVMDEPLVEDGESIAVDFIHNNRLYRVCCKGCAKKIRKDSTKYDKKIDAAVVKAQRERYPLETCVVAGGKLGSMGEPAEMVVGNRLVRFCCGGCTGEFEKNTPKYVAMIDEAWKTSGTAPGALGKDGDHEHDHARDHDRGGKHDKDHDHGHGDGHGGD